MACLASAPHFQLCVLLLVGRNETEMLMRAVRDVNTFLGWTELLECRIRILKPPQLNVITSGCEVTSYPALN